MQYVGALIVIVEMIGADTGTARTVTRAVAVDQDVAADIITSGQPQPCSEPPRTLPQNVQMFDDTTLNAAAFVMVRFRYGL